MPLSDSEIRAVEKAMGQDCPVHGIGLGSYENYWVSNESITGSIVRLESKELNLA